MLAHLGKFVSWLTPKALTLLVLAGLTALAVWGHQTGWKLPRPGSGAAADDDDEKKPDAPNHKDDDRPPPPPKDYSPSSYDPTRKPDHDPARCPYVGKPIRFKDHEALERAAVTVGTVGTQDLSEQVEASGALELPVTAQARISARAAGVVWRLFKTPGQSVERGEVLALVESPDVGKTKAEFLQAWVAAQNRKRTLNLLQGGSGVSFQNVQAAEAALREAKVALANAESALTNLGLPIDTKALEGRSDEEAAHGLRFLGLPKALADRLSPGTAPANLLPVVAPPDFRGQVLAVEAVEGEMVPALQPFIRLVNTERLVVRLDVHQEDAGRVKEGQEIEFRPDGADGPPATGRVTWVSPTLDERTRTVAVRALVENHDGRLRALSFGIGRVILRRIPNATVVPRAAAQWEGCCHVVFVRAEGSELEFSPRRVKLGLSQSEDVQVLEGLRPGESVAVTGSHVLKSELFKDRLGEGE